MRFEVTMKMNQRVSTAGAMVSGSPQPLLDLYRQSDLVAIAQIGQSTIVETEDGSKRLKTALRISSQFKGENNQQVIPLYFWDDDIYPIKLEPGDRALVLIQHRESEEGKRLDGYESTDRDNSIKKLDDAALAIYRQRLEELTAIYRRGKPEPAELVEWLVRCVEEPATREEGVLTLSESLFLLTVQRERENEAESKSVEAEESAGESEDEKEADEEGSTEQSSDGDVAERDRETAKLAAALTQDHKNRLANTLFGIAELSEDDLELVRLVEELGDERLAPYLVTQLRRAADDAPRFAESIAWIIAQIINDEDLKRLASEIHDSAIAAILNEGRYGDVSDRQDSTPNRRSRGVTLAAIKRSGMLKDFLKLVEYKTRR